MENFDKEKKTLSKYPVYTIKVLMGIGGKCKDNINMADFEEYVALYVCILSTLILRRRLRIFRVRPTRMWSRAWLQRRRTRTCYNTLLQELRAEDVDEYKNYMRMSKETFNMLLEKVRPYISSTKLVRSFTNSFVQLHFDILVELVCLLFPAIFTMCFCLQNILMILITKTILIG
jgi:hypothetical protein